MTRYKDANPIRVRPCAAWLIYLNGRDKPARLMLTAPEMTIEEVVRILKVHRVAKRFAVQQVDVGEFNLDHDGPTIDSYSSDGRKVTDLLEVVI